MAPTWVELKDLCEQIKQNPDEYHWIIIDTVSEEVREKIETMD